MTTRFLGLVAVLLLASVSLSEAQQLKKVPLIGILAAGLLSGENITGSTNVDPDLSGKRLELLKEVYPSSCAWRSSSMRSRRSRRIEGDTNCSMTFRSPNSISRGKRA
jgi:hypothetical protein